MLEEVKRKVQVWKREVYGSGEVLDEAVGGTTLKGGVEGEGRASERRTRQEEDGEGKWKENFPGGKWSEEEFRREKNRRV